MNKYFNSIVTILKNNNSPVTAGDLAKQLHISTKTVYRSINSINKEFKDDFISSRRGLGYSLNLSMYDELVFSTSQTKRGAFSPIERRNQILSNILFKAPMESNLKDLYKDFYVSKDLMYKDIKELSFVLNKYNITLKNSNGYIYLIGSEESIRQAINGILVDSGVMNLESVGEFADKIEDINSYDKHFLLTQLSWMEKALDAKIPYPYNVNIFSHLYIVIKRFRNGMVNGHNIKIESNSEYELNKKSKVYLVVTNIIKNIGDYLSSNLPEAEKYNLFQYLISMRYTQDISFDIDVSSKVLEIVEFYLEKLSLNPNDEATKMLKNDLIGHIKPMLNRISNHIFVFNKLLKDIKQEYKDLFFEIKDISKEIEKQFNLDGGISDDEVGFITLYFANYFENISKTTKALIMCASGIGTSKLLYAKVHKAFPNLMISGVISKYEYESDFKKYNDIDLIISTVNVVPKNHAKVLITSAIFSKNDKNRVEEMINYFSKS